MSRFSFAFALAILTNALAGASAWPKAPPPTWHALPCRNVPIAWETLAQRKARPACWAQLGDLCVPEALWLEWLTDPEVHPWCGKILARWRVFSPPQNSLDPLGSPGHAKLELERWQASRPATGVAAARGFRGLPLRIIRRIEWVRERCSSLLAPLDPWGIFRASLLGEAPADRPIAFLRILGFVHLAGASGIHLYALAAAWEELFRLLAELLEMPVGVALPLARALGFVSWAFAWCLAGARRGMLRPWIVVMARRGALLLGFRWRAWAPLALALLIELAVHGWGTFDSTGRIFYALSVGGGLMVVFGSGRERPARWALALGLAVGSWIFAGLWEGFHGEPIALATPLLSLVTIPLFCLLAYPALLGMAALLFLGFEPGPGFLAALRPPLQAINAVLGALVRAALRIPQLWIVSPRALLWGAILALGLITASSLRSGGHRWKGWRAAGLGLLAALGLVRIGAFWLPAGGPPRCPFSETRCAREVEQLDVGQGDAALVRGEGAMGAGLIDTGSERALGDSSWIRIFSERGVHRISWIALTHLDEDHSGGVRRLARLLPIRCVVTSRGELMSERGRRYARDLAELGVPIGEWSSACVPYPYFAPPLPRHPGSAREENGRNQNMGAVLVPLSSRAIYLSAGDADAAEEVPIGSWASAWITRHARGRVARFLKISHHGSSTSSCEPFLRAMAPDQAWISVGLGNLYGHPSWSVLRRLEDLGIPILRTDRDGSLKEPEVVPTFW